MEAHADVQYIFDENGRKTAVIVPITMWETMIHKDQDYPAKMRQNKIESLFGTLKDSPVLDELEEYSRRTREGAVDRI